MERSKNEEVFASLIPQLVKNPPAMQETRVRSLGWEDLLEKEMIIYWEIPWTEEPGRLQSMGVTRVRHDLATEEITKEECLKMLPTFISRSLV